MPWITATTQNYVAYLAFEKIYAGKLLVPIFRDATFKRLPPGTQEVIERLSEIRGIAPDHTGLIKTHYGTGGLYQEDVNENNPFPLISTQGDGILLIVDNS
jgi:hypothetical protein